MRKRPAVFVATRFCGDDVSTVAIVRMFRPGPVDLAGATTSVVFEINLDSQQLILRRVIF